MFKKIKLKFIFNICQAFKNLEKSGYKTKIESLKSQLLKTNISLKLNFLDYLFKKNNVDKNLYLKQDFSFPDLRNIDTMRKRDLYMNKKTIRKRYL